MSGKRLLQFGFDGMNLLLLRKFNAEGILPNFADLLERGSANRLLCTIPAWTPTNWASVLTGATTGTHGLGGWSVRVKTDPWDALRLRAEDSEAFGAETIWEVAGNTCHRCFARFFPSSRPSRIPGGYVVAPGFQSRPRAGLGGDRVDAHDRHRTDDRPPVRPAPAGLEPGGGAVGSAGG